MTAPVRQLRAWYLRHIRRGFCFACDRTTFHEHRHSLPALNDVTIEELHAQ